MSFLGKVGDVTQIGSGVFEWRIPDFLSLTGESGDHYNSALFESCGALCFFKIYPYGLVPNHPSDWVPVFLQRLHSGPPAAFRLSLGIRGWEGVENRKEIGQEFSAEENAFCWYAFCSRCKLRELKSRLMPEDILILKLEVKSGVPRATNGIGELEDGVGADGDNEDKDETSKSGKNVKQQNQEENTRRGIEKMAEDIGKLLSSGEMSDVTVQVGDIDIRVHSAILSARCPALCVSLQHDSMEKETRRIVVEDCRPEIFRDFLQYLYTGSIESLTEQNVFDLHRVADRYLADDLKQLCLGHVRDNMSVQTFCDAVRLALTHGHRDLLEQATGFASENIRLIIRSVEWQRFLHDCPTEANEILIKSLGPPS